MNSAGGGSHDREPFAPGAQWLSDHPDVAVHCDRVAVRYAFRAEGRSLRNRLLDSVRGRAGESGHWGLKDCSFDIRRGEVVGVVGRNGAGKSTLLRVLSRTLQPSAGRVYVRGPAVSVLDLTAGMDPHLTGRENMTRIGMFIGLRPEVIGQARADAIEFASLGEWVDRPLMTYSSGMRMRLAFSFFTALPFDVLILDEVMAVGDRAFTKRCVERIWNLAHQGRTMVVASHDHAMLRWLCSLALWLDEGKVRHLGPTDWVVKHYEWFLGVSASGDADQAGETQEGSSHAP